jgi:HSP20 family protein
MFLLNRTWNPAQEIERLRDEFDHLFLGATGAVHAYPAVNVWGNEHGAVLTAELPGLSADDVEIGLHGDTVTLKGSRPALKLNEGETLHRSERQTGSFVRSVKLPFRADADKSTAQFKHGVLTLTLARAEADLPRKIAVKAE